MKRLLSSLLVLLPAVLDARAAVRAADVSGLWLTENGNVRVRVAPCGGGYCGTIAGASGRVLDTHNSDPALRGRSVVGIQILDARQAEGSGFSGSLYNPNDGKTYSGSLRQTGSDSLEVSGCVLGVFCKRQTWTRVQ